MANACARVRIITSLTRDTRHVTLSLSILNRSLPKPHVSLQVEAIALTSCRLFRLPPGLLR